MATPHVSGVAALIWSANPNWTNVQIRNALTGSALDLGIAGEMLLWFWFGAGKNALDLLGGGTDPTPTPTFTPTFTPTPSSTPTTKTMNLTVTTDKATYSNNQTVYVTVTAKETDGSATSGASVNITIKEFNKNTCKS